MVQKREEVEAEEEEEAEGEVEAEEEEEAEGEVEAEEEEIRADEMVDIQSEAEVAMEVAEAAEAAALDTENEERLNDLHHKAEYLQELIEDAYQQGLRSAERAEEYQRQLHQNDEKVAILSQSEVAAEVADAAEAAALDTENEDRRCIRINALRREADEISDLLDAAHMQGLRSSELAARYSKQLTRVYLQINRMIRDHEATPEAIVNYDDIFHGENSSDEEGGEESEYSGEEESNDEGYEAENDYTDEEADEEVEVVDGGDIAAGVNNFVGSDDEVVATTSDAAADAMDAGQIGVGVDFSFDKNNDNETDDNDDDDEASAPPKKRFKPGY